MPTFRLEKDLFRRGHRRTAGVDEVGRGSLFGPVVAAAVVLPEKWLTGRPPAWARAIDDSKLLVPARRKTLASALLHEAESLGIGIASSAEIDTLNIFRASQLAMRRALENLVPPPDLILVDGVALREVNYPQMALPRGDRRCVSIAAASIVAKVFRDDLMDFYETVYSGYGLSRNKGYGTDEHFRGLRDKGPTCLHRVTFKLG